MAVLSPYDKLVSTLKRDLARGRGQAEQVKIRTNWQTGRAIDRYILKYEKRAKYGTVLLRRLARDVNLTRTHLYYCLEFAREYSIVPPMGQLTWSHYRYLLSINDRQVRERLTRRAMDEKWSRRTLQRKIREVADPAKRERILACLIPRQGKLKDYPGFMLYGRPCLDLGFRMYHPVSAARAGRAMKAKAPSIFTYRAGVGSVIDGDTLWVVIDLGFGETTHQKLRLRGIDAPEMNTPEGRQAREYLQKLLQGKKMMTVTTSKKEKDKYDRYLADVFAGKTYVNQAMLDAGCAVMAGSSAF